MAAGFKGPKVLDPVAGRPKAPAAHLKGHGPRQISHAGTAMHVDIPRPSAGRRRQERTVKKCTGAGKLLAPGVPVASPSGRRLTDLTVPGTEPGQGVVNPMVGAVSTALLTGPWIVALVKGVSVPLAVLLLPGESDLTPACQTVWR
jgi:hypothetical protein